MAANAYVLLNVEPARTKEVVKRLRAIPGTVVQEVLGPYDIIVKLERDTTVDITSVVQSTLRTVPGVTDTITCICIESLFGQDAGGK